MPSLTQRRKSIESSPAETPGLVLLDRKQRPIFYNAEAARILNCSLTHSPEDKNNGSVAAAVRAMLVDRRDQKQRAEAGSEIMSWQTFAVFEGTGKRSPGTTGILIEMNRAEQKRPDVPTIAREF